MVVPWTLREFNKRHDSSKSLVCRHFYEFIRIRCAARMFWNECQEILCTSQHFQEGTCIRFTFYIPYRLGLHVKIYDDLSDRINIWPKDDDWIPVCNESGCWWTPGGEDFENNSLSLSRNVQTCKCLLKALNFVVFGIIYSTHYFLSLSPTLLPLKAARNLNPVPYSAVYMGHKVHIDQNEKLVMFRVTHVLTVDGFSSKCQSSLWSTLVFYFGCSLLPRGIPCCPL